jgi:hypothetical protein
VERIRARALAQKSLPGSAFRKALEYTHHLWRGLTLFLSKPAPSRPLPPTPHRRPLRAGGPGHEFAGKRYGEPVSKGSGGAFQQLPKLGGCP